MHPLYLSCPPVLHLSCAPFSCFLPVIPTNRTFARQGKIRSSWTLPIHSCRNQNTILNSDHPSLKRRLPTSGNLRVAPKETFTCSFIKPPKPWLSGSRWILRVCRERIPSNCRTSV